jgi:organic radical activating enzyme
MSWETFIKAVNLVGKDEIVELYGHGEPFLHPQIIEMGEYLNNKGIKYRISTNCLKWTPEQIIRLIKANAHFILSWVKETDIRKVKAFACLCQGHSATIQPIGENAKAREWAEILRLKYSAKKDGTQDPKVLAEARKVSFCQNPMIYGDGWITTCCRDFSGKNVFANVDNFKDKIVPECRDCKDIWL